MNELMAFFLEMIASGTEVRLSKHVCSLKREVRGQTCRYDFNFELMDQIQHPNFFVEHLKQTLEEAGWFSDDPKRYTPLASTDGLRKQLLDDHLRVWREDGKDGITWDQLQVAKNEAFGEGAQCVEVYPAQDEMVYEANVRHLWLVPSSVKLPSLFNRGQRFGS